MAKKEICPEECLKKHSDTRTTMAIITNKLENIENNQKENAMRINTQFEENTEQHTEILKAIKIICDTKADKVEVEAASRHIGKIYDRLWAMAIALILTLIGVCGYFLAQHFSKVANLK